MDKDTLVNLSVPSIAKRPDAQKALAFFTDYLPEGSSLSERHYCLKNSLKARPRCEVCGSEVNFQLGKYNRFCSRKCSIAFYKNDASIKKKISESNKRTAEQAKEKRKETNLKRYGVECTFTTINNDRKAKGLVSPSVSKNADVSSLLSESVLREMHHEKKLNLIEIANELGVTERAIWNRLKMFSIEQMYWGGSSLETRICDFLEGLGVQFKRNYKPDFLQGKEIDIWIPESKLGLEINGLYWHSEHKRPKTYHHDKARTCLNNGVRLIQFWEHEIIEKEKLVFSMIRNAVGRSEIKLSARDCIVVESTKADREPIKTFLNENHLKGYHHYSRAFLLKNKDGEILSIMTFSKPRFSKSSGLELIRFCSKMNTTIRGGAGKLWKHCTSVLESDIMTYADLRYSTGSIYRDVFGMEFEGVTSPGFFWANSKLETRNRLTLINQIVRNEGETQEAAARRLGWFKVFDCGNLKFSSKRES